MATIRKDSSLYNILYSSPMIVITILTLLLLTYVGFGEAKRKYSLFQLEKMESQMEIVKNAMDAYLKAGLPIRQFSGYMSIGEMLLKSDSSIVNIRITDSNRQTVFEKSRNGKADALAQDGPVQYRPVSLKSEKSWRIQAEESKTSYRVVRTLKNKFGIAGYASIEAPKEKLLSYLYQEYVVVFYSCVGLFLLFSLVVVVFEVAVANNRYRRKLYQAVYVASFLILSTIIAFTVFTIYEHGAKASTKAFSDSMTQRLEAILDIDIDIKDISGIDETFRRSQNNNRKINSIAIVENGISISHSDAAKIGKPYVKPEDSLEYINQLDRKGESVKKTFRVAVTMPRYIITEAILGSSKAFVVLLIACILISLIFLNAGSAIQEVIAKRSQEHEMDISQSLSKIIDEICRRGFVTSDDKERLELKIKQVGELSSAEQSKRDDFYRRVQDGTLKEKKRLDLNFEVGLKLIKPAYFLIVFVNALSLSFLPQLVSDFAQRTGSSIASASLPFTIYYLSFALVMIPAGQYAEKGNLKKLMGAGFLAEMIGLGLVALSDAYWTLTIGRFASGIGQGIFLIGLQSYVLVITPHGKKSLGHAVKVIGRNSGLIAGTAIGALLYTFMSYRSLFTLASLISLSALLYLIALVPRVQEVTGEERKKRRGRGLASGSLALMIRHTTVVLRDGEFIRTLLSIGIVGKISIAGVVMFAVPLLLSQKGFATEDIGLALMLYYIMGMITTNLSTKIVDKPGATRWVLSISAFLGGTSSLFLGFIGIHKVLEMTATPGMGWLSYLAVGFNKSLEGLGVVQMDSQLILFFILLIGISNGLLAAPIMTHIGYSKAAKKYGAKSVSATYVFLERFGHVVGPSIIGYLMIANQNSTLAVSFFGVIMIVLGFIFMLTSKAPKPASAA